ncbi:MAG: class I SAM-dependent rRNA methyltransferase [Gammaproteobacteria bacterium]|jgi:23S rRNA (cytosine1962-C5)-methyltransferase|nr:class I SAM-dependent rRNA methyltransferase [Gammaproteobacteria bacterium]MBT3472653.1 class I SAM-dependent rRNA methyltransferase [Gammaproteobacteria bacterium]MBT3966467.1 class I SAM-dependent rRNA methyltransferase [Gammaproteobacteria bacterium]MBT4330876.1 class I SAM-dependent rRNA methyltransferase [Gammaproteobacteria bacterium]MBT6079449.1 class I SAM-dependent rRNA methyltransferase [Gammaproteobacteria bacterium]
MNKLAPLKLKKGEDRRLHAGHLWVYSNEIDTAATPLSGFTAGQQVEIQSAGGKVLGNGYINPNTLIAARLVSRNSSYRLDQSLITHRLKVALSIRERLFPGPYYRLVHGDSDGLPGLVVDRFGDTLSVQITTAGMELLRDAVIAALEKVLKPSVIVLKNDTPARLTEGLEQSVECVLGEAPERVALEENGVRFEAPLMSGQKTGWYYDHRISRERMQHYVSGLRVLDLFSYIGGWGVQAAVAGAKEVICVDASEKFLEQVHHNAALNNVTDQVATLHGDAFDALKELRNAKEQFDLIIVDPPAFIKRKKDQKSGLQGYRRINELAMRLLSRDGILISASCSHHLQRSQLKSLLLASSRHIDRNLMLLEEGHQGPDHPIHPAIPETEYIKTFFGRVLPNS